MNQMTLPAGELIRDWHRRARENQYVHYETGAHFSRLGYLLGVPSVVLSAIVGTAVFASLAKDGRAATSEWVTILIGFISVVAATLTSLQTFMRYPERAARHRQSGAGFGALRRELEYLLALPPDDPSVLRQELEAIRASMDKLALESPEVPSRLKKRFDREVPKGNLQFLTEKVPSPASTND